MRGAEPEMKIYSWNMLFRNRELDRAFDFIRNSEFDIFCLQEVPEHFLPCLKALPYHVAEAIDVERLSSPDEPLHLVTLSRYPIVNQKIVPFPEYWPLLSLRTRVFVHLMRLFHWSKIKNRTNLYVDIAAPAGTIRVFNLHTALTRMDLRVKEFETVLAERDPSLPTIVCGDFNTIESPRVSLLNWLLGGPVSHAINYTLERTHIEKRFMEHELHNPLRGQVTHLFADSQLDHILVSRSFTITSASVLPDRVGSDHHPIRVHAI